MCFGNVLKCLLCRSNLSSNSYVSHLMPSSHHTIIAQIFHLPTVFGDRWINRRLIAMCELFKDTIQETRLMQHRCPKDVRQAKYLDLPGNAVVWKVLWLTMRAVTANETERHGVRGNLAYSNPFSHPYYFLFSPFFFFFAAHKLHFWTSIFGRKNLPHGIILVLFPVLLLAFSLWNLVWKPDRLVGDSSWWKIL